MIDVFQKYFNTCGPFIKDFNTCGPVSVMIDVFHKYGLFDILRDSLLKGKYMSLKNLKKLINETVLPKSPAVRQTHRSYSRRGTAHDGPEGLPYLVHCWRNSLVGTPDSQRAPP